MSLATKAEIKAASQRRYATVTAGGLEFRCQSLNAKEYLDYLRISKPTKKQVDCHQLFLIAACLVDDEGKRLFGYNDVADLYDLDAGIVTELYLAASEHCGLYKAEEDAEKNLEPTPTSASA